MGRFAFQIEGLTEKHQRRWEHKAQSGGSLANIPGLPAIPLIWLKYAVVAISILYVVAPFTPTVEIGGQAVSAKTVLVMKDRSGSMKGEDKKNKLKALSEIFKDSNINVLIDSARGFGVATDGDSDNLLYELQDALKANPDIDAVYVFSDFSKNIEYKVDGDNSAGYQNLRELLDTHQLRLYLGTVKDPPRNEMIEIAIASGGGLIENR